MTRLVLLPEAEEELAAATEWYESRRSGLGLEFLAVVDRTLESILAAPMTAAV